MKMKKRREQSKLGLSNHFIKVVVSILLFLFFFLFSIASSIM